MGGVAMACVPGASALGTFKCNAEHALWLAPIPAHSARWRNRSGSAAADACSAGQRPAPATFPGILTANRSPFCCRLAAHGHSWLDGAGTEANALRPSGRAGHPAPAKIAALLSLAATLASILHGCI